MVQDPGTPESGSQEISRDIPLYLQKRRFTCGPSSVMMAMSALDATFVPNETVELELWREATTIHGGCGPLGLAIALAKRDFDAVAIMSHDGLFLGSRASNDNERETMGLLQARDLTEAQRLGVSAHYIDFNFSDIAAWMDRNWHPIVMFSIIFEGRNITHWVIITGVRGDDVYINDPLVNSTGPNGATIVAKADFEIKCRFGPLAEKALVLAGPRGCADRPPRFGRRPPILDQDAPQRTA